MGTLENQGLSDASELALSGVTLGSVNCHNILIIKEASNLLGYLSRNFEGVL